MLDFVKNHGYSKEAEISFPIDTFKVYVDCPSEIEVTEATEEELDDEESFVAWESRPLRPYISNTKNNGFVAYERNVRRLAAEMSLEYDFFK